jgi:hypothetical protein
MANRVLRSSLYHDPWCFPFTVITRECDLAVPIQRAAEEMEDQGARSGCLVVTDIFDLPDALYADPVRVSMEGTGRLTRERLQVERNMAMSYFWNAEKLNITAAGGFLVNPGAAPILIADLQAVMLQLTKRENYQKQTLIFRALDETVITLRDGVFKLQPPEAAVAIKVCDVVDQGTPVPDPDDLH